MSVLEDSLPPTSASAKWSEFDRSFPMPARHFAWFAWLDPLLGLALLVPGLPIIGVLSVLTRLTSRGPGIYRQTRVGYQGRTFVLYKIRTMSHNAEAETGPVWASGKADPRVTRIGRFLRTSHLDELPQLFNVIRGEMALIGPRPERPEFTQFLAQEIPRYVGRLSVKPGITGLAQINLPPDSDLDSVREKLALDLEYIQSSSFMTDVRILVCTGLKMLGFKGPKLAKWFGLKRRPTGEGFQLPVGSDPNGPVDGSLMPAGNGLETCSLSQGVPAVAIDELAKPTSTCGAGTNLSERDQQVLAGQQRPATDECHNHFDSDNRITTA